MSEVWREEILERDRRAHEDAWEGLIEAREKNRLLRQDIEEEIGKLRKEFGIEAQIPLGGGRYSVGSDPVFQRIEQDRISLAEIEGTIETLAAKIAGEEERYARLPAMVSRSSTEGGVDNEKRIADNQLDIKKKRDEQSHYLQQHSKWRLIERKIQELQEEITLLEQGELDPVSREQLIPNEKRAELGDQIEREKNDLAVRRKNLTLLRDRIAETDGRLSERIDAQRRIALLEQDKIDINVALGTLSEKIASEQQIHDLRQSPAGNPFEVLDPPRRPSRPTDPDPLLIVLFSLVAGLGLGLGLATLAEYNKSCFRSIADVGRVMIVPVLGTINTIRTDRERIRIRTTRTVVGGATFVFVASLAFITWAWAARPQLLSSPLRDAIEELRENFE
jgi:hypothetical protein